MTILSLEISKKWLISFMGGFVILLLLITIGDIINGILQGNNFSKVFFEFSLKLPDFIGKILPLCSLLASVFALNSLRNTSELMAILASGFSANKFSLVILLTSFLIALFQFINLGFLLPYANSLKRENFQKSQKYESRYIAKSTIGNSNFLWYKTDQFFISFSAFDVTNLILKDISLYIFDSSHKIKEIVKSPTLRFTSGSWFAINPTLFNQIENYNFPESKNTDLYEVVINLSPSDFDQFKSDITTIDIFKLRKFLLSIVKSGINSNEYQIMLFEKIALSIMCLLFALFPLYGLASPNRRSASVAKNIVGVLIFAISFWLAISSLISHGYSEKIPTWIACFGIPIIFLLIIIRNTITLRRL